MTTMQSTFPPAPGLPQHESRFPFTQRAGTPRLPSHVNPEDKSRTNPFVPLPIQEFDEEEWVCCRGID